MQVFTAAFDDPHDMGAALRTGAQVEYLSYAGRSYRARLTVADFGGVRVNEVEDGPHSARARNAPDRSILIFGHGSVPPDIRINGCVLGDHDGLVVLPGSELRSVVASAPHWLMVDLPVDLVAESLDRLPAEMRAGGFATLRGLFDAVPGLRQVAREAGALAQADPSRLLHPGVAPALREALCVGFAAGLQSLRGRPDTLRAERAWLRLVSRAEAFLDSVLARAVYTEDVCQALGVAPRALNEAFNAVYGMSLHRALRIRRLNLARQRLRLGGPGPELVKIVAIDVGFWHLGRFSVAYRGLFGETPSETLAGRR